MIYGRGPMMTVNQLVAKLQAAVAEHPELGDVVPTVEGCDCGDDLGDVEFFHYTSSADGPIGTWSVDLRRSDAVEREQREGSAGVAAGVQVVDGGGGEAAAAAAEGCPVDGQAVAEAG